MEENFEASKAKLRKELMNIRTQMIICPYKKDPESSEYQELLNQLKEIKQKMARLSYNEEQKKEGKGERKRW